MDVNFNPSTGFKRPHPGAQEEPQRAVRARPESARGQGSSTSWGGEPDAPLPALGNLSAWADSLPSFNFPPDADWETPLASPTASVELSTIIGELQGEPARERDTALETPPANPIAPEALSAMIRELQGEPARERDTASAPPPASSITSGVLSAMIREHQSQPEAFQDTATSVFRQESDADRPTPVFAGNTTEGMEAFDLRGHLPMDPTGEAPLQNQNAPVARQAPRLPRGDEPDTPPSPMENLSAWADSLLSFNLSPASTEALPACSMSAEELFAIQDQPVALQDASTSMSRQRSDANRPAPAFADDATEVDATHQGRQSTRQNPLHINLLAARERLAAGSMPIAAARELNIDISTLVHNFDRHGHLMINVHGRRLLESRDAQVARQAQQLPRALVQADLDKLIQVLRDNVGREPSQLHTALQNLPNPVAPEALAFLVDAGGLRADRLAQLPDAQRQALEAAHQGRQSTLQNPVHRNLLAARQRLVAGATVAAVARELNIPRSTLTHTFDRHGHLMISDRAKALLQSRDAQVARQAQQLPRALTPTDLNKLTQALRDNADREPSQLHTALRNLPNPVAKEALEFLVDADGLRADRLALLPDAQRQALEAVHQDRQIPFQNPLHRNLLAARERLADAQRQALEAVHQDKQIPFQNPQHRNLLAARERLTAGATFIAAARELNISKEALTHLFDRRGHLIINIHGRRLLQSRDAQVARQAQQLPRALTQADLDRLTQALRDNAGREPSQLHTALQNSPIPVAPETLAFLVDASGLRADRLAQLPDAQRQALEAAHQGRQSTLQNQNPLHRNLLAARQRLAAGATPTATAHKLNIPKSTLTNTFDRHGHLMINSFGGCLLQSRDAQVARQAQQLPRALTPTDLDRLTQVLRDNVGREPSQLHIALQQAPTPIAKEALEFLVDAGSLRADRLAQLPDEQRQELEAAHQGRQSTLQIPLHRNLLVARQRLAEGVTAAAAARELNISRGTLTHIFDRHGHLMISNNGNGLLRSRDAQVARQARQLPRALTPTDLNKLTQALRDNAGREPSQLHTALQNLPNPVAKEALAFLVDADGLRADRLALLPDEQRQLLEEARSIQDLI